jgi:hypothetical protein
VDELTARRQTEPVGTSEYAAAFRSIRGRLSDAHKAMLKAHVNAPRRTLTATDLAAAAGYGSYSAANLQYGFVGKWLHEEILCPLPQRADGSKVYTCALAVGDGNDQPEEHWRWVL